MSSSTMLDRCPPPPGHAQGLAAWALEVFHPRVALSCSFSAEDIVLIDMLRTHRRDARVFAIDTGRLNEETYEAAESVRRRYGLEVEWYFPRTEDVERLEREAGLYSFRDGLEQRHRCCHVRKVEPLGRALRGLDAWITGLRRAQSVTRASLSAVERDDLHGGIVKVSPLLEWTDEEVWEYVKSRDLPRNRLYDSGYASIGCAPCTRAIRPGEHARAGRWWWEAPEHKECGLHARKTGSHHT